MFNVGIGGFCLGHVRARAAQSLAGRPGLAEGLGRPGH